MGDVPLYVTEFGWTTDPPGATAVPARACPAGISLADPRCARTRQLRCRRHHPLHMGHAGAAAMRMLEDWFGIHSPSGAATPDTAAFAAGLERGDGSRPRDSSLLSAEVAAANWLRDNASRPLAFLRQRSSAKHRARNAPNAGLRVDRAVAQPQQSGVVKRQRVRAARCRPTCSSRTRPASARRARCRAGAAAPRCSAPGRIQSSRSRIRSLWRLAARRRPADLVGDHRLSPVASGVHHLAHLSQDREHALEAAWCTDERQPHRTATERHARR